MRHALFLLATLIALPLAAKIKTYNKEQYKQAEIRFNEVTGTGDPKATRALADSLRTVGRSTDNYAVEMLYFDAMTLYYYYSDEAEAVMTQHITDNYAEGMQRAKELGSEQHYWQFYKAKVINQLNTSSADCLEQAEEMLKEVENEHSDFGMMYAYNTLAYIYNYRNEMMMAIDVLQKAVKMAEGKNVQNDDLLARAMCDLIYASLSDYLYQQTLYDEAIKVADHAESFIKSCPVMSEENKQIRLMDVYARRAVVYFDQWKYKEFDDQIVWMKKDADFDSYMRAVGMIQLYFYYLLREGHEDEIKQFMATLDENEQHQFRYYYYRYHNKTKEALHEDEQYRLYLDSLKYQIHAQDLEAIDAKMGNVQLREEKLRLEAQQFKIKALAAGGILLVIVISVSILLMRHRRHAKQLLEKNVQLSLARDEAEAQRGIAEEQRAEAETQRAEAETQRAEAENQRAEAETQRAEAERQKDIAEEQRSIAEEQRNIAEEQRSIAEEQRSIAVKAQKVAERANEMKGEFILSMMHEIRTPLNHIKGFSAIIADPNMHGEADMMQEASNQISNSTNHLTHLLDDILQLGKFDGMADVEKADANAVELLLTAMMNSPQADPAAVEMIPAIEEVDPCLTIQTNMDMAQKALSALINNAVKFTQQGHIKLGIETEDGEEEIRFYVEDTGPGIPAGQEERIFERFVKLDEFVPGTGLGLSLADVIAKVLGGRVYVDTSYAGPGARFVMALPK